MAKPSSDWTIEALREHFEQRLNEMRHDLEGFPEHYALTTELASVRARVESVTADHIGRDEFARALDPIREEQERAAGRRGAFTAVIALMMLGTSILWGEIRTNMIRHSDVSAQIQKEAPWVTDRPNVESRLSLLERDNERIRLRLTQEETLSKFFCRTRTPQLPGC